MKKFFNLFLILVMPISLFFILATTIYYKSTTSYTLEESGYIALVVGVLLALPITFILAFFATSFSFTRKYTTKQNTSKSAYAKNEAKIILDPTIYKKKSASTQEIRKEKNTSSSEKTIKEQTMLLVNKELAYEIALNTVKDLKISSILHQSKEDGYILLKNLKISIISLSKHNTSIAIATTDEDINIQKIISTLKEKEHALLKY